MLFFDLPGRHSEPVTDRRALTPNAQPPSQLRFDHTTGEWVIIAPARQERTYKPPADRCPLCPGPSGQTSEIPASAYDVVVFENRFASLSGAGTPAPADEVATEFVSAPGRGRCEVVCFTSDHSGSFAALPPAHARLVVDVWRHRTRDLLAQDAIEQVFCFENRGEEIGVTLSHPHGQIYAYPTLPPRTTTLLRQAEEHRKRTGRSLLRDVLDAERRAGTRVVVEGEHWTAYVPAAARWPVELHVAPHRDVADLTELNDAELDELSHLYLDVLGRLDRFFDGVDRLPYIAGWHQAPIGAGRDLGRLYLQVFSLMRSPHRMKFLAGSESGMGAWISDTTPERIAARFREVAP